MPNNELTPEQFAGNSTVGISPDTFVKGEDWLDESFKPSLWNSLKVGVKSAAGNLAGVGDFLAGVAGQGVGVGVETSARLIGAAQGQDRDTNLAQAAEMKQRVAESPYNPLSSPIKKMMKYLGYGEDYDQSEVNQGLQKVAGVLAKGGQKVEELTGGALKKEDVAYLLDAATYALGVGGAHATKGKITSALEKRRVVAAENSPEAIAAREAKLAEEQKAADVKDAADLSAKRAVASQDNWTERQAAEAQREEMRQKFAAANTEEVKALTPTEFAEGTGERGRFAVEEGKLQRQGEAAGNGLALDETSTAAQKIAEGRGFDLTAEDKIALREQRLWEEEKARMEGKEQHPLILPDEKTGWIPKSQSGGVSPELLTKLGLASGGAALGYMIDKDNPAFGSILGAVGGLAASRINPRTLWSGLKTAVAPDARLRINDLANTHEYNMATAAREIYQVQAALEKAAPQAERRAAITHWIEGDTSIQLTPKELEAAQLAKGFFTHAKELGLESNVLKNARDNYVTHLWGNDAATKNALAKMFEPRPGGPSMSPESRYALRRQIPTIAKGKELGLTPLTEDVSQIIGIYGNSIMRSIENKRLLTSLKEAKTPDNVPLLMSSTKAPADYVAINHPQMAGMRVHPDIASSLKFMFDSHTPGAVMAGLEGVNTLTKRLAVSFSLFHAKALTDALIGAASNPLKAAKIAATSAFGTNEFLKQIKTGGAGDLVDMANKGGLKFTLPRSASADIDVGGRSFFSTLSAVEKSLNELVPKGGLPVKAFAKINHLADTFMWERLHAGMKLSVFAEKYAQVLENNAKANARDPRVALLTKDKAAEVAASFTNDTFGGINWRRIAEESTTHWGRDLKLAAYSPTGRRMLQLLLFAPDWTISTTRAALKAFGPGSGLRGIVAPRTVADLHRQYILRSALYYGLIGDGINYTLSGHHLWDNKDPTRLDMGDGRTMQWSKHTMEPIHWALNPGQQALNKLGFIPREALNQALGKQYLTSNGKAPPMDTSVAGRLGHVAKSFSPIAAQQALEGDTAAGIAGFFGAPIYGKTFQQRAEVKAAAREKRKKSGGGIPKLKAIRGIDKIALEDYRGTKFTDSPGELPGAGSRLRFAEDRLNSSITNNPKYQRSLQDSEFIRDRMSKVFGTRNRKRVEGDFDTVKNLRFQAEEAARKAKRKLFI